MELQSVDDSPCPKLESFVWNITVGSDLQPFRDVGSTLLSLLLDSSTLTWETRYIKQYYYIVNSPVMNPRIHLSSISVIALTCIECSSKLELRARA